MKIAIAGSSGFIGTALRSFLKEKGHTVVPLIRGQGWDPSASEIDPQLIEGVDAVINLCGENIATGRWTPQKKRRIFESRVNSTRTLAESVGKLSNPPKVLVNASAIGFYGERGDERLTEESGAGTSYLAQVCQEWEYATEAASRSGVRVVNMRMGLVLSPEGGAMKKMLLPFKLGLGGVIGTGEQWVSWIALADLLEVFMYAIESEALQGPINAVAPEPATNRTFTKALGKALRRPTWFPLPAFLARCLFGREMADSTLLCSTRVEPKVLNEHQFSFSSPKLADFFEKI